MKTITKIGLAALFPLISATPLQAGFIENASTSGGDFFEDVFFGGAFGQSEADGFCNNATNCNGEDTSWKVYGGYKINHIVDAEVSYQNIGDISRTTAAGTEVSEISALSAHAVGKYRINQTVEALGKIGVSSWNSDNKDGDESGVGLSYGFGAKVDMNESMKIRAEWETISGVETSANTESDITTMSLGIELQTL